MHQKFQHIIIIVLLPFLVLSCSKDNSKALPSLVETYGYKDKRPFGGYVAHRQLDGIFPYNNIRDVKQTFSESWKEIYDTAALYISISRNLYLTEEDLKAMLDYTEAGNDIFIAAANIEDTLLTELGCEVAQSLDFGRVMYDLMKPTKVSTAKAFDSSYGYYYMGFERSFRRIDSANTRILGYNDKGRPNFIVIFRGKGKIFLHCDPRAFSNYFLMTANNHRYLDYAFSFADSHPDKLYWDDFYNKINRRRSGGEGSSAYKTIMGQPALAKAFWFALIGLLLYILYGMKRTQRKMEVLKPNANTTVTFTETIGRLYLQEKDNRNIAEKMITYFNEQVRNNYFLNTNVINAEFLTLLSRKSGVEYEQVARLYGEISKVHSGRDVTDMDLLALNEQIQQFNKKIKS